MHLFTRLSVALFSPIPFHLIIFCANLHDANPIQEASGRGPTMPTPWAPLVLHSFKCFCPLLFETLFMRSLDDGLFIHTDSTEIDDLYRHFQKVCPASPSAIHYASF